MTEELRNIFKESGVKYYNWETDSEIRYNVYLTFDARIENNTEDLHERMKSETRECMKKLEKNLIEHGYSIETIRSEYNISKGMSGTFKVIEDDKSKYLDLLVRTDSKRVISLDVYLELLK